MLWLRGSYSMKCLAQSDCERSQSNTFKPFIFSTSVDTSKLFLVSPSRKFDFFRVRESDSTQRGTYVHVRTYVCCSYAVKPRYSGARTEMTSSFCAREMRSAEGRDLICATIWERWSQARRESPNREMRPPSLWASTCNSEISQNCSLRFRTRSGQVRFRTRWFRVNEPNFSIRPASSTEEARTRRVWETMLFPRESLRGFARSIKICPRNFAALTTDSAPQVTSDILRENRGFVVLLFFFFFFQSVLSQIFPERVVARAQEICQTRYD